MTLIWGGLSLGAIYAIVAIGYNIVFISSKTFNFAHAQLTMVGAFVAYTGLVTWDLPPVLVVVMAALAVAVIAAVEERIAIRPVGDMHNILVTTLGASILLDGIAQLTWGTQPLTVPFFGGDEAFTLLGGRAYPVELFLIALAVLLVIALGVYSRRSLTGLALLGMAEDREAALLRGVNVRRMAFMAFVAAGALAGFAGMFVGSKTFAVSTLGAALALKGFVVLAIGGFGSMPGTLVGGAMVGLAEAYASRYLGGEYANLAVFLILITILMVRPAGLFVRTKERVV
ncbi:branched-chain amino acid ABC transporter permease [Nocardioides nitrophenolicus]|uniref:branched-chain amino acid ABC transporter permease n=1 Tax=Nocardioides nitrophenolicus TaxID=60489 RepID=UPI00195644FF|nr:branched-chain amino acid ABC transporter permease [Nocardioides nitrophenolicus]MBM7517938.1 branched-chain amino acid transport system permease protein [Nocardioides nitrophenolicus]